MVRVTSALSQATWDSIFPNADSFYTYDGFIRAVSRWPYFCGEANDADVDDDDLDAFWYNSCKVELATFLAHARYHSEDLTLLENSNNNSQWSQFAAVSGVSYVGRGPFMINWNGDYGRHSAHQYPSLYGKQVFLDNPELVLADDESAFFYSLWFYMLPMRGGMFKSMHDIILGFYEPTSNEAG